MDPAGQVSTIRNEVEAAADAMISAATMGLRFISEARAGDAKALDALEETFFAILEACAFQDITGQRLTRLSQSLTLDPSPTDPLLHGPQDPGAGLDQAAADDLFGAAPVR